MKKRILAMAACAVLTLSMTACEKVPTKSADIVATYDGGQITYEEYTTNLEQFAQSNKIDVKTLDTTEDKDQANQFRESSLDNLINFRILLIMAKEKGMDKLTKEETAQIKSNVDNYFATIKEQAQEQSEPYTEEYVTNYYTENTILNKLYESVAATITVDDADIQEYYNKQLALQEGLSTSNADAAFSAYAKNENSVNLYVPKSAEEKIRYAKHVLIKIPDEIIEEIDALKTDGKTDEATAKYNKELEKLLPKANEVYEKAIGGQNFDELVTEFGEDGGMKSEPAMSEGYMVYEGSGMVAEFEAGVLAFKKVGDISKPIATQFGYHIIKYESSPTAGAIEFDKVKEKIKPVVENTKITESWNKMLEDKKATMNVVKNKNKYLK